MHTLDVRRGVQLLLGGQGCPPQPGRVAIGDDGCGPLLRQGHLKDDVPPPEGRQRPSKVMFRCRTIAGRCASQAFRRSHAGPISARVFDHPRAWQPATAPRGRPR
jgi:hypothetical protein